MKLEPGQTATVYVAEIWRDQVVHIKSTTATATAKQVRVDRTLSAMGHRRTFALATEWAGTPEQAVSAMRSKVERERRRAEITLQGCDDELAIIDRWKP